MRHRSALGFLALTALISPAATAQGWNVQPLVLEGDTLPGTFFQVEAIQLVEVNDSLDWRISVDTNHPDPDLDDFLLTPAGTLAQEGQLLLLPIGAGIDDFHQARLREDGTTVFHLGLEGVGGGLSGGAFVGLDKLLVNGDPVGAVGYTPGTTYYHITDVLAADNGDVIVKFTFDDPLVVGVVEHGLVRLVTNGGSLLLAELPLAQEGQTLPGTSSLVTAVFGGRMLDVNDSGSVLFHATIDLPADQNGVVMLDTSVVAQEGQASPVPGRVWQQLTGGAAALGSAGDHAIRARLDGDNATDILLAKNGVKVVQEGDPVPGIPAFQLIDFENSPLDLSDEGELLWYGRWNEPTFGMDAGLFVDHELIVQEGVTLAGGIVIQNLDHGSRSFAMSDDGDLVVFTATLGNGETGAFLATRPGAVVTIPGCSGDGTTVSHVGGAVVIGDKLDLSWVSPSPAKGPRFLGMSSSSLVNPLGCGLAVPGIGEILIGILPPDPYLIPQGFHVGTPAPVVTQLPLLNDVALVGATLHFQGLFLYEPNPTNPVDLTNGLDITFGL